MNKAELKAIDIYAGIRVRQAREDVGISQDKLASLCGISCQQTQKYENARNRISVSRLHEICRALNCKPRSFFPKRGQNKGEQND